MKIEYEKIKEKFEDENEVVEQEIINITAETETPLTPITFSINDKHLATTMTDAEGYGNCGFSPKEENVLVKAVCADETATVEIPAGGG